MNTWYFGAPGSGLYFTITFDGTTFTVDMEEGSMDLNALWISDGNSGVGGSPNLSKKSPLDMNGTDVVWDDVSVLSQPGTRKGDKLTSKSTYLEESEEYSISLNDLKDYGWDTTFIGGITDWGTITLGVRATSVTGAPDGATSIKYVAEEGDVPLPAGGTIFVSWESGIWLDDGNGVFDGADTAITDSNNLADFDFSTGAWTVKAFVDASPGSQVIDLGGFGLDDSLIIDVSGGFTGYTGRTTTQPANGADGFGRIKWFSGAFQSSHVTLGGSRTKGAAPGQVHIGSEGFGHVYFTDIAFSRSQVSVLWPTQTLP